MPKGRLVVNLQGETVSNEEKDIISHPNTAGIILFSKNCKNREQLMNLIKEIQDIAIASGKIEGLPIFVDQECAFVQRVSFSCGVPPLPNPRYVGKIYDNDPSAGILASKTYGQQIAEGLKPFGLIPLAPVLDLDRGNAAISPLGRAFHENPKICATLAQACIEGMHSKEMPACGKHFPGHGTALGDSHTTSPMDSRSLDDIEKNDLIPFIECMPLLSAIMPAHIVFPEIGQKNPASFSRIWLIDLLRNKFNFKGVTISDALDMVGAGDENNLDKVKRALNNGLDIALLCNKKPEEFLEVLKGLGADHMMDEAMIDRFNAWVDSTKGTRLALASERGSDKLRARLT